jgi:hypothetical protein
VRRLALLATAAAFLVAVVTASAQTHKLVLARCSIGSVVVNTTAGTASAAGKCTLAGRPIASALSYSTTLFDGPGYRYACTPVKGQAKTGRSFKLQPAGAYGANVTFTVTPKGHPGKPASKTLKHKLLGGDLLQCGKPLDLPDPNDICSKLADGVNCGVPFPDERSGCAFTGAMTFTDNTLRVGHVSCQWGTCWFSGQAASKQSGTPLPATSWLGMQQERQYQLHCANTQNWGYVGIGEIDMTTPDGEQCHWNPTRNNSHIGAARMIKIPADWGGSVVVYGNVDVEFDADIKFHRGQEWESSAFKLGGTQNGCAQLTAPPTG